MHLTIETPPTDSPDAVFAQISDALSTCRTHAMMGKRAEAFKAWNNAKKQFEAYRQALQGYPSYEELTLDLHITVRRLNAPDAIWLEDKEVKP